MTSKTPETELSPRANWHGWLLVLIVFIGLPVTAWFGVAYLLYGPAGLPWTAAHAEREARNAEIRAHNEKVRAKNAERDLRHAKARILCLKAVRTQARFPSKAEFDPGWLRYAKVGYLEGQPDVTAVRGTVEMMNGFGAMIPHSYGCDIKDGRVLRVSVEPG